MKNTAMRSDLDSSDKKFGNLRGPFWIFWYNYSLKNKFKIVVLIIRIVGGYAHHHLIQEYP